MLADLLFAGLFLTVGGILRVLGEGVFAVLFRFRAEFTERSIFGAVETV